MSHEMWHFDIYDGGNADENSDNGMTEGTSGVGGEVMFNKLINGFLLELFKCFQWLNANHLVSIILFT
jgi:hypothetical protein